MLVRTPWVCLRLAERGRKEQGRGGSTFERECALHPHTNSGEARQGRVSRATWWPEWGGGRSSSIRGEHGRYRWRGAGSGMREGPGGRYLSGVCGRTSCAAASSRQSGMQALAPPMAGSSLRHPARRPQPGTKCAAAGGRAAFEGVRGRLHA